MRITRLTAENVKRLKAVDITPEGDVVVISGRNAQGKTSVLDSIWLALGGGPAKKEAPKPIREGQEMAYAIVDLGDIIVRREWTRAGTTRLTVTNRDGAKFSGPQEMLDQLVGRMSFDPLLFTRQTEKEQLSTLLGIVDLGFDPDELAARRKALYEERTVVGREVKRLEGVVASMPEPPADLAPIDMTEITKAMLAASERNGQRKRIAEASVTLDSTIERLRLQLDAARLEREAMAVRLDELGGPESIESFVADQDEAEQINLAVRNADVRAAAVRELDTAVTKQADLTALIEGVDARKATAVAEATMPITGLAFDDEGVTYNDVPFRQCSASEQLRVSVAMAIAANPAIRVIRITDGSLLDSGNMALLAEMAKEHDAQIWVEVVDETGQLGVVIEDGSVVAP